MKIKLSKSQWEMIGKTAGWIKVAQVDNGIGYKIVYQALGDSKPRYYLVISGNTFPIKDKLKNVGFFFIDQEDIIKSWCIDYNKIKDQILEVENIIGKKIVAPPDMTDYKEKRLVRLLNENQLRIIRRLADAYDQFIKNNTVLPDFVDAYNSRNADKLLSIAVDEMKRERVTDIANFIEGIQSILKNKSEIHDLVNSFSKEEFDQKYIALQSKYSDRKAYKNNVFNNYAGFFNMFSLNSIKNFDSFRLKRDRSFETQISLAYRRSKGENV